jgi:hypothetical protein
MISNQADMILRITKKANPKRVWSEPVGDIEKISPRQERQERQERQSQPTND